MKRTVFALLCTMVVMTAAVGCGKDEPTPPSPEMTTAPSHDAATLKWETDWDAARKRAKTENRPILVNFYADWCIWCKRLDATTFEDREVVALLEKHVIPLRLEIDGVGRIQASRFGVQAPPTLLFVSPEGAETGRILGYVAPSNFLAHLTQRFSAADNG